MRMLIVCQGNFVKSPAIEAILRARLPGADISSAGMRPQFENRYCYVPMIEDLEAAGYSMAGKVSTRLKPAHFNEVDVIFAVETQTYVEVNAMRPQGNTVPIAIFSAMDLPDIWETNDPPAFRRAVEAMVDQFISDLALDAAA